MAISFGDPFEIWNLHGKCYMCNTYNGELVFVSSANIYESGMYFPSMEKLLHILLKKKTHLLFHTIDKKFYNISISEWLGKNIEEMNIKLDLLGV